MRLWVLVRRPCLAAPHCDISCALTAQQTFDTILNLRRPYFGFYKNGSADETKYSGMGQRVAGSSGTGVLARGLGWWREVVLKLSAALLRNGYLSLA